MKRRLVSLLIVSCVLVSLCVPALALEATYPESPNLTETGPGGSTVAVELDGSVKFTNVKVTVPTKIPFVLDPTVELKDDGATPACMVQVTQPDSLVITNYSPIELFVGITEVSTNGVELVKTVDALKSTYNSIFLDVYMDEGSGKPSFDYTKDMDKDKTKRGHGTLYDLEQGTGGVYPLGSYGDLGSAGTSGKTEQPVYICATADLSQWGTMSTNDFTVNLTFVVSADSSMTDFK